MRLLQRGRRLVDYPTTSPRLSSTTSQPTTGYPYRVYGTQQDNTAISTPSRSSHEGILWNESYHVGSSESGHIAVRPDNPDISYSGAIGSSPGAGATLIRYDRGTEQSRLVTVWPDAMTWTQEERPYRFQWELPHRPLTPRPQRSLRSR